MSKIKFDEYRFHFKPKNYGLFNDEDMKEKNKKLSNILNNEMKITYLGRELRYQKIPFKNNKYYIRLANKKNTKLEKNFTPTYFENEPSCSIFIWNDPQEQKIFIESDRTSFNDSKTVAKILITYFNSILFKDGLCIDIRKEIEENEFWNLVKKHKDEIREIEFTLIYPNLPAAHKDISDDLKDLSKSVKADESTIAIKAKDDNVLNNINPQNKHIKDLNSVTSTQGTPTTIRIKNYKGKIKTGKTTKTVIIEDGVFSTTNKEELEKIMNRLF